MANVNHVWKFFRAGGFDQVKLESGADLANLDKLDQKLWVALSCPTRGLEFDSKTLDLIDTDKDGRIRAPEIIAVTKWVCASLKNPDTLIKSSSTLPLDALNDTTPEGKQLLNSARHILENLGKSSANEISIEDMADTARIFAQTNFNGDGIVAADAAEDASTKAVIADIIACLGAEMDRSGKPGVNQAKVDQFFTEAQAHSDWWKKAETDVAILPAGEGTAIAFAVVKAVKAKVDDYFARCRLVAFDSRSAAALNREEKEYLAMTAKDLTIASTEIAALPLARIEAGKPLSLLDGVNPAWAAALAQLQLDTVKPLLGDQTTLSESEWATLNSKLAAYQGWLAAKAGGPVEKLGLARIREILSGNAKETITALIAKDKAVEGEANSIAAVDKLVRLNRDLYKLLVNYVNFSDFYGRKDKAIFQAGTLYLDQRSCDLCLTVEDAGKHAAMAGLAGAYLAYCDCVRKSTGDKLQIVAAFTDGDSDNLMVGRNGIFYDRKGRDWDATISKVVDNPISIRQAFWSPYKKLVRMIEEQVAKRAAAADAAATAKLESAATTAVHVDKAKPAEPKKLDVGTVAAIGVAFGAIGTFAATVLGYASGIMQTGPTAILAALMGLILVISGPSVLIAWLKLRKRNLGPILDANGWALNAKARINVPFGGSLTEVAKLPPGAQCDPVDLFADKKSPWPKVVALVVLLWLLYTVLNNLGFINEWTDGRMGTPRIQPVSKPAVVLSTNAVPIAPK
ncbi:MAG: hypothetical protein WCO56_17330 [Verrucomicrobiota bacterium]